MLDDLQSNRGYHPLDAYRRAKLMNLVWTVDLARRLEGTGISVFAADPGVADTGTHRDYPWPAPTKAVMVLARPLLRQLLSAEKAAVSSVHAASAPELHDRSGLLVDRKGSPVEPPEFAGERDIAGTVDGLSRELLRLA